ncbi:NAD(P)-dependent oxidoreductase [Actinoplanes sp. LDG1-06]|uniref:NAD(P)-dependent oxidoreductase n=1 Tax=Paractinoplanes ovalisporus TaxID=2810368 RepID=A0ABS2AS81_9ACTN|nr:NAD(P)-dependent oxidoreductase [Actinoplanes ovalisporus]MBM2622009.1 NAD(P)-dependent oxidoreductase [Actinoplanes ovalisporus]
MARIAVTGGSGKLGRAVVQHLLDHGNEVVNLDRAPSAAPTINVDLSDFGQVVSALTAVDDRYDKIDAVVHLAAIPAPGLLPNAATFHNNITVTYNVFAAARTAGIKTIVWASSETVLGLPFETTPPPYLPADEEYPARPNSSYSLAKHLEEQMAEQFCRWDPTLTMIGLRFSNVMEPADYAAFPGYDADPHARSWNAWGYIDARDGAQAVRRALAYGKPGLEVFVIANADTVMSRSSASLAAEVFPDLPVKKELAEHETLLSIDKARRLLGYEPEFTWRTGTP